MNALVFLYRKVLQQDLEKEISAMRARKKINMPVVMTRDETARVLTLMTGTAQLVAKLLYGSGLRISEAIRLRIKDVDCELKTVTVRSGKGNKDRVTTFPATISPFLKSHLTKIKTMHRDDLKEGYGKVYLPHALDRKYPNASQEWGGNTYFLPASCRKIPAAIISDGIISTPA